MGRQHVCAIRPADREMPQTTHIQSAIEALLLDPATLDQQSVEKIKHDLESWFQKFMDSEFREIVGAISEEFADVGES